MKFSPRSPQPWMYNEEMADIYLETSFISACVSDRDDVASAYRRQASLDWWQSQRSGHQVFVSPEVIRELEAPGNRRRGEALDLISDVQLLELNEAAIGLAKILVAEFVMPEPAAGGDALHVALATLHKMHYILSWNVRHLANPNKLAHLRSVCVRVGMVPPQIVTPDLLWEEI